MPLKKIKSSHPESQGPFVLIEESEFNPTIHKEYSDAVQDQESATKAAEKEVKRSKKGATDLE